MRRDLAAIDREQRRAAGQIELEHIFAGRGLGFARAVVVERAYAGIGPDHIGRLHRFGEIFADGGAEIFDLRRGRFHEGGIAVVVLIGGADQREVILIGNDEDDAAVAVLEHVGAVVIVELAHHDVRSLHEPHFRPRVDARSRRQHLFAPWAAGVDQHARADHRALAASSILRRHFPDAVDLAYFGRAGAGVDFSTAIGGIARGEYDEARVVDEAIRVFETLVVA